MESQQPTISVVIPCLNEEHSIERLLSALNSQTYPRDRFEVIVVDNGSIDNSLAIAQKHANQAVTRPGIKVAGLRNEGAKLAKGSILAFVDADCIPCPTWLEDAATIVADSNCITGAPHHIHPQDSWVSRTWFRQKLKQAKEVPYIASGNLIVPKDIFDQLQGFNEGLTTGEDTEFCARARKQIKIIADPRLVVIHSGTPQNLWQFIMRESWHGLGATGTFKINRFDKPLIGTIIFLLATALQIIGLLVGIFAGNFSLFLWASLAVLLLIIASAAYRLRTECEIKQTLLLALLYYCYFLGRGIALIKARWNSAYYRKSSR